MPISGTKRCGIEPKNKEAVIDSWTRWKHCSLWVHFYLCNYSLSEIFQNA